MGSFHPVQKGFLEEVEFQGLDRRQGSEVFFAGGGLGAGVGVRDSRGITALGAWRVGEPQSGSKAGEGEE